MSKEEPYHVTFVDIAFGALIGIVFSEIKITFISNYRLNLSMKCVLIYINYVFFVFFVIYAWLTYREEFSFYVSNGIKVDKLDFTLDLFYIFAGIEVSLNIPSCNEPYIENFIIWLMLTYIVDIIWCLNKIHRYYNKIKIRLRRYYSWLLSDMMSLPLSFLILSYLNRNVYFGLVFSSSLILCTLVFDKIFEEILEHFRI